MSEKWYADIDTFYKIEGGKVVIEYLDLDVNRDDVDSIVMLEAVIEHLKSMRAGLPVQKRMQDGTLRD